MSSAAAITSGDATDAAEYVLEVGSLSVQLIAARNIKLPSSGGYMEMLLNSQEQPDPYCRITLGEYETTSGMGVKTAAGYTWNREQIFLPVKVPMCCVVGASGDWNIASSTGKEPPSQDDTCKARTISSFRKRGSVGGKEVYGDAATCRSSNSQSNLTAEAVRAHEVERWLTLHVQVFHRANGGKSRASGVGAATAGTVGGGGSGSGDNGAAASTSSANSVVVTVDKEKRSPGSSSPGQRKEIGRQEDSQSGQGSDRLLGECTLDLVSVVSGRVLHMEEWVPLSSGGDLKLSLDYDSVGTLPSPGDSVVLLCLSSRLDFFPLPVWDTDNDPARPRSPSWLWARGGGWRPLGGWGGNGRGGAGGGGGFCTEEVGDSFCLISYPSPEGWRCAVEVHRFLVHRDPTVDPPWSLASVRDHALSTPAAVTIRDALLRAREEESFIDGVQAVSAEVLESTRWTMERWWSGGLDRIKKDVMFASGIMDRAAFEDSQARSANPAPILAEQSPSEGVPSSSPSSLPSPSVAAAAAAGRSQPVIPTPCKEEQKRERQQQRVASGTHGMGSEIPLNRKLPDDLDGGLGGGQGPVAEDVQPQQSLATNSTTSGGSSPSPTRHLCPITRCPMVDPAVAADGYTYERAAIERWLSENDTSPVTGQKLETKVVFKNWSLVASTMD